MIRAAGVSGDGLPPGSGLSIDFYPASIPVQYRGATILNVEGCRDQFFQQRTLGQ